MDKDLLFAILWYSLLGTPKPLVPKELEEKVWFCHAGSVLSQCAQFEPNLCLPALFLSVVGF